MVNVDDVRRGHAPANGLASAGIEIGAVDISWHFLEHRDNASVGLGPMGFGHT